MDLAVRNIRNEEGDWFRDDEVLGSYFLSEVRYFYMLLISLDLWKFKLSKIFL